MPLPALDGWIPANVGYNAAGAVVDWCYLGRERMSDPFFDQTLQAAMRQPFNQLFWHQTPIDTLLELQARHPGVPPAGFIFHMSRCGSTLVAQMLAALRRTIVVSEAAPIDSILSAPDGAGAAGDSERIAWLRAMLSALGQPRVGVETHLIVKFDCWNTPDLPLVERAFPGVPWVFLYRDPVEVLVSQIRQRALFLVPGALKTRLHESIPATAEDIVHPEEFCARFLAQICQAAVEPLRSGRGRAINYNQLPAAVWTEILDYFHLAPDEAERQRLQSVSRFDAKSPGLSFEPDTATKQRTASPHARAMADRWLRPVYDELEAIRLAQH